MLTGNKGEWSEAYVFLRLLAEGRLNAADQNLIAIPNVYYPIIKIIRNEENNPRSYLLNGKIDVVDNTSGIVLLSISIIDFIQKSNKLFTDLKAAKGKSISFPVIETFLNSIDFNKLKAKNIDKSDIKIMIHDINTGMKPTLGFSIKSLVGKDPTLFNAGIGTNFIFKLTPPLGLVFNMSKFNTDTYTQSLQRRQPAKIAIRLQELIRLKFDITFTNVESETLKLNLQLIDSKLPEILSQIVYYKYKSKTSKMKDLLTQINNQNPLGYDLVKGHPFYEVKIKNFLTESALGMTPETVWTSVYNVTGGLIIVKKTGDIVCYHIYNRNEFQEYLINRSRLDQPATSEDASNPGNYDVVAEKKYRFGWVYQNNGEFYIKLNLQIRIK